MGYLKPRTTSWYQNDQNGVVATFSLHIGTRYSLHSADNLWGIQTWLVMKTNMTWSSTQGNARTLVKPLHLVFGSILGANIPLFHMGMDKHTLWFMPYFVEHEQQVTSYFGVNIRLPDSWLRPSSVVKLIFWSWPTLFPLKHQYQGSQWPHCSWCPDQGASSNVSIFWDHHI